MRIQKSSLAVQVKEMLIDGIVKGKYQPGERLVELTIAKELGISQAPVREAFQMLETMRLVESQAHRGTRIREITDREMSEGTLVRGILEEAAARMAVGALKGRLDDLRTAATKIREAFAKNDFDGIAKHASQYHRIIVEACGNGVLIDTWESLSFETTCRINTRKAAYSLLVKGVADHDRVLEAIEKGDGAEAGRLLREMAEGFSQVQSTISTRIPAGEFQRVLAEATTKTK